MFTPIDSAVGALLIHLATTEFVLEAGKTVGFSSIITNALFQPSVYPVSIVCGLALSTLITLLIYPEFVPPPTGLSIIWLSFAGFLVGVGTKWGSGCTSGHMLCGVSLLRKRSLIATMVFSSTAMLVVNCYDLAPACDKANCSEISRVGGSEKLLTTLIVGYIISKVQYGTNSIARTITGLKVGFLFGLGLFVSGMANPAKPQGFLALFRSSKWDPSLIMIVIFAIIPNIYRWRRILLNNDKPVMEPNFDLPTSTAIPPKFLLGNALFGLGWGMAGICPGPGLVSGLLSLGNFAWLTMFLAGQYIGSLW